MASTEVLHKKVDVLLKLRGYRRVGEEKERGEGVTDITVVKRGTKKKLLMRIATKSKLISGNIGVKQMKEMGKTLEQMGVEGGIMIGRGFTFSARQYARKAHIEILSARSLPAFNIFKHKLVPKHEILSKEEAEKLLKKYRIKPYRLPQIKASDPAARMIGAKQGDVLKITRKSPTAGRVVVYRYVI